LLKAQNLFLAKNSVTKNGEIANTGAVPFSIQETVCKFGREQCKGTKEKLQH